MKSIIASTLCAFALSLAFGPFALNWLRKLKFGQTIYDLGPQSHKKKQGTPTMGGIIFAVPALVTAIGFWIWKGTFDWAAILLVCTLGFGLIGFVDDYIKVHLKRSLGLTPKQKLIPQIVLSAGLAVWAYVRADIGPVWTVPFSGTRWNLGIFYIPIMVFVLVGTVNSANLLDGLDGLCGSCSLIDFAFSTVMCLLLAVKQPEHADNLIATALFAGAFAGGVMGFLRYNGYPAQVFMGDVGSFFLGGALCGIMLVTGYSLLLPIVALAMFLSSLSDIIQISYFKLTHGKRVFKMAPLHHHFELCGMPETKIVMMYDLATLALCLLALLGF